MKLLHFTVTLLEDVIFSERSATEGSHATLDHLPGAAFLGYCAGRLYTSPALNPFTLFHSGAVRFGSAYPLDNVSKPMLPVPLCWHLEKGKNIRDLGSGEVVNLIHTDDKAFEQWEKQGIQQKQIRNGYFSESGNFITPERLFRLKSAIDRNKMGRAADRQLFGYESLAAGSRWHFSIGVNNEVDSNVADLLKQELRESFRVGHSRTAEYGLIEVKETATVDEFKLSNAGSDMLLIYAMSDIALRDQKTGAPVLEPKANHFKLPETVLFCPEKSYLRTRSYAPFNSHRRTHDLERQVIIKGSVLAFRKKGGQMFSLEEIKECREKTSSGVGAYLHDGLGMVLVQPEFLEPGYTIKLVPIDNKPESSTASDQHKKSSLENWLEIKTSQIESERETTATVANWVEKLVEHLDRLPKNSQWGELRNIAMSVNNVDDLKQKLFHHDPHNQRNSTGFCYHGVSEKQWKAKFELNSSTMSYRDFLEDIVIGNDTDYVKVRMRLYHLANRLPHRVNQLTNKKEAQ
jgi:hypothetical protein